MPHHIISYRTILLHYAVLSHAVLRYATLCYTILYRTISCSIILMKSLPGPSAVRGVHSHSARPWPDGVSGSSVESLSVGQGKTGVLRLSKNCWGDAGRFVLAWWLLPGFLVFRLVGRIRIWCTCVCEETIAAICGEMHGSVIHAAKYESERRSLSIVMYHSGNFVRRHHGS